MAELPAGATLILTNATRISRNYHAAVALINDFYASGKKLIILNFRGSKKRNKLKPLEVGELHELYTLIWRAERLAGKVASSASKGISIAKDNGRYLGSCKKLSVELLTSLKKDLSGNLIRGVTLKKLQQKYCIARSTLYRYRQFFKSTPS